MSNPPNDAPSDVVVEGDVSEDGQGLQRDLNNRHLWLVVLGGAIGTGMLMGSSNAINQAGLSSMLAYAVVGFLLYFTTRAMSEMLLMNLKYKPFRDIAEGALGPAGGFIVGWTHWFAWIVAAMGDLTAIIGYAQLWWPEVPKWLPAAVLALLLPVLNVVAVRYFGEVEFWFTLIKLVAVGVLLIAAASLLFSGPVSEAGHHATIENLWDDGGFSPNGFSEFLAGFQIAFFAFVSLEVVGTVAAETHNPECNLPKAINAIPVRLTLFYILVLVAICVVTPWRAVVPSESPFTTMSRLSGFGAVASVMNFVLLTAAASSDNSGLYSTSRMMHGLTEDGQAPRIFGKPSRRNVPQNVLICFCLPLLYGIGFLYASETTNQMSVLVTSITSVLFLFIWVLIVVCYIVYRKKHPELHAKPTYKMSGSVGTTRMVFVFFTASLVILCLEEETLRAVLTTPIWFVIIIPCYFTNKARNQRTAPVGRQ